MKKNYLWLTALLVTLAFVFPACGGDDDPGTGEEVDLTDLFSGTVKDGPSAIITLTKTTMSATKGSDAEMNVDLLTKEGGYDISAYKGIKFEYKTTNQANCGLQDSGDPNTMWMVIDWGAFTESDWTPAECIFEKDLIKGWGNSTAFDRSKFEKLFFGLGTSVTSSSKIEMRNFVLIK